MDTERLPVWRLLYLGVGALFGNKIWHNIVLSCMYAKKRPRIPLVVNVKWSTVQLYTLMQVCIAGLIFGIAQFSAVGK